MKKVIKYKVITFISIFFIIGSLAGWGFTSFLHKERINKEQKSMANLCNDLKKEKELILNCRATDTLKVNNVRNKLKELMYIPDSIEMVLFSNNEGFLYSEINLYSKNKDIVLKNNRVILFELPQFFAEGGAIFYDKEDKMSSVEFILLLDMGKIEYKDGTSKKMMSNITREELKEIF